MEWLSVDRIENEIVVCETENREKRELRFADIDGEPREGDMLFFKDGKYHISAEETAKRREKILRLQRALFGEQ